MTQVRIYQPTKIFDTLEECKKSLNIVTCKYHSLYSKWHINSLPHFCELSDIDWLIFFDDEIAEIWDWRTNKSIDLNRYGSKLMETFFNGIGIKTIVKNRDKIDLERIIFYLQNNLISSPIIFERLWGEIRYGEIIFFYRLKDYVETDEYDTFLNKFFHSIKAVYYPIFICWAENRMEYVIVNNRKYSENEFKNFLISCSKKRHMAGGF